MSERCDCPAGSDENPNGWHSEADHAADCPWARGVGPADSACGGCWGCQAAQAVYYSRHDAQCEAEWCPEEGGESGCGCRNRAKPTAG